MKGFPAVLENIIDLNLGQIKALLSLTSDYKKKDKDLVESFYTGFRTPVIATSFLEDSTRTKHSFAIAIQKLGGMYIDFNADICPHPPLQPYLPLDSRQRSFSTISVAGRMSDFPVKSTY